MSSSASRRERAARERAERKLKREEIVLSFDFQPGRLRYHGPIITTALTITQSHRDALVASGAPLPSPVSCRFLLDTGADGCVVKHEFAIQAGLKLINANAPLHGVGVDTSGKAYIGRVLFGVPSRVVAGVNHQVYVDTQIMSGDLNTLQMDGLIGRDVLQHFTLTYDGKSGRVTMRYHRPPT
jgi:hypothetical protein